MPKRVIVAGPPCSGKSSYVRQAMQPGDLVYDYDTLHQALSGQPLYHHDKRLTSYVVAARDRVLDMAASRSGDGAWVITGTPKAEEVRRLQTLLAAEVVLMDVDQAEAHRRCTEDGRPDEWHGVIDDWFSETDIHASDIASNAEGRAMPWTTAKPPAVAKNWTDEEKQKCVAAANAALKDGKSDADAIYACIAAAGKGKRMRDQIERLVLVGDALEVRVEGEGAEEKKRIGGYAAVFDSWSNDLGGFRERIAPGAFSKTLQEADVRGLLNHDPNYVLGRTKAETLELSEDSKGLRFEVTPPDTQWARDLLVSIQRGDINQMSFGFRTIKDTWGKGIQDEQGRALRERTLLEVALYDVSLVTFPAYPATEAGLRVWRPNELYTPEPPADDGHSDEPGHDTHSDNEPGQALHSLRRMRINLYERMCVEA